MIQTFDYDKNFISQIDSRQQRNVSSEKFSLEQLDVLSIIAWFIRSSQRKIVVDFLYSSTEVIECLIRQIVR